MLARKPGVLVTVALANKMARIFWARMALGRNLQSSGRGGLVRVSGVGEAKGQARGLAQRSEDRDRKTSEMFERLERAKAVWTRPAICIQASGV